MPKKIGGWRRQQAQLSGLSGDEECRLCNRGREALVVSGRRRRWRSSGGTGAATHYAVTLVATWILVFTAAEPDCRLLSPQRRRRRRSSGPHRLPGSRCNWRDAGDRATSWLRPEPAKRGFSAKARRKCCWPLPIELQTDRKYAVVPGLSVDSRLSTQPHCASKRRCRRPPRARDACVIHCASKEIMQSQRGGYRTYELYDVQKWPTR